MRRDPLAWDDRPAEFCSILGCTRMARYNHVCISHYVRIRKYGSPHAGQTAKGALTRAISRALRSSTDDCILWSWPPINSGYGQINLDGRRQLAHRVVCEQAHGQPPSEKHEAAHSCGKRLCINPRHLRWATKPENEADKLLHGTYFKRGTRK